MKARNCAFILLLFLPLFFLRCGKGVTWSPEVTGSSSAGGGTSAGNGTNSNSPAAEWAPTDISDILAWYKADSLSLADGASLTTWSDSSGNGHTGTAIGGTSPTFLNNEINQKPAVVFGGAGAISIATRFYDTAAATGTIFIIAYQANAFNETMLSTKQTGVNNGWVLAYTNGINYNFNFPGGAAVGDTTPGALAYYLHTITRDGSTIEIFRDGTSRNTGNAGAFTASAVTGTCIGATNSCAGIYFQGRIPEIIFYNRVLTSTEIQRIECYLKDKYNLTLGHAC